MDNERAVHRRLDDAWYGDDTMARSSARCYARAPSVRNVRRASTWTAAALIATVAATTGYLAHAIPVSGAAGTGTSARPGHAGKSGAVTPGAPVVGSPVVTSGGSGVAAGSAGGSGRGDS